MIPAIHLIENRVYLISVKSVEQIPIFKHSTEKRRFRRKINFYLEEICEIFYSHFNQAEFHMIIKMKDRKAFEGFYSKKYKGKIRETFFIPISTYIFGRQMSNLLVSFVKSYNYKFDRQGVLMDGRYRRQLIESENEMNRVIGLLKSSNPGLFWAQKTKKKGNKDLNTGINEHLKEGLEINDFFDNQEKRFDKIDLRGCFVEPFQTSLIPPIIQQKVKIFRANYPCGPNYN